MTRASVFGFFVCLFGLLASGHLGSSDAGGQLRAATRLVQSGRLSTAAPPAAGWLPSPDGRFYEVHDIGAIVLMLPAAVVASRELAVPASAPEWKVPRAAAAVASFSYAMLAALACWWMFRALAVWHPPRRAFGLAVAFPFTTILTAYGRTAWDVLGCAAFVAAAMAATACALTRGRRRQAWMTAVLLGAACAFRFSFAPFAAVTLGMALAAMSLRTRERAIALTIFFLVLTPSFAYNALRTGAFWRPPTALPAYLAANNAIDIDVLRGLFGLLLSPNRGLFVFSPILLLIVAVPAFWRGMERQERRFLAAFGAGAVLYLLLIASLRNWGAFGWGPRYLVPILPIGYFAAAGAFIRLWPLAGAWRPSALEPGRWELGVGRWELTRAWALAALLACSIAVTLPSMLVNWPVVVASTPRAADQVAPAPVQIQGAWRAIGSNDPVIVPDVWEAHVFRRSRGGRVFAAAALLGLVAGALISLRRILRASAAPG